MRIALVSEHASPLAALGGADAGGQNVHVAHLAAGLAERGHDVVVHTRRDDPSLPDRVATPQGYVVDHVTAGPAEQIPKDELVPHLPALAEGLAERWLDDPVDVVHAHFWMSGVAASEALRRLPRAVPELQTFHALGVVKRRHQGAADTSPPSRLSAERRLLGETTQVIATCSDEVRELRALGLPAGHASVIPCGVDTATLHPGVPIEGPPRTRSRRLLAIGRLVPRKGVDTVVRALEHVPDTELVVAGGPPPGEIDGHAEVERLRTLARGLGVADRIHFLGAVRPECVPGLMRSSDIVVTAAWYEPFGIVPVEAMACGVPVVATAVGGHLDTVVPGVTGELVTPREPEELAVALRGLLDDPERRAHYGRAGRRRACDLYDWSTVVERTELVYRAAALPTRNGHLELKS